MFLLDERVFLTLGILRVAACLEQKGHAVEMLDTSGISNFEDAVQDHARNSPASIFGITATTPQMPATTKVVAAIRKARPDARVIIGGPHVTLVNAAVKREKKLGMNGRATRAMEKLHSMFDVIVAGDGDDAIFEAIKPGAPKLIDADDPSSELFLTNDRLEELPFPARHLVDVDSYHYTVEGERALSMIAQLGCLDGDTLILMANGEQCPIRDVQSGNMIRCYDTETNEHKTIPVAATWKREADDLHELEWSDGTKLRVTGEHPIWTKNGWRSVLEINAGESAAAMPQLREAVHRNEMAARKVLQLQVPLELAEDSLQPKVAQEGTTGREGKMVLDDARPTGYCEQHRTTKGCCQNETSAENFFGNKNGRQESHEAARGCGKGVDYDQKTMGKFLLRADEEVMEIRSDNSNVESRSNQQKPKRIGDNAVEYSWRHPAGIHLRWERCVLDRTMHIWKEAKPGFYQSSHEECNPGSWGVLALKGIEQNRSIGLQGEGMDTASGMVPGIEAQESHKTSAKTPLVWTKLVKKTFIGKSSVFNITVHPVHTYFANGLLVHNCPFACGFCGGRESPMLRRIRTRSTESVVREAVLLHESYGVKGIMYYDDELNVNPKMIGLMEAMAEAQKQLGVSFRQRGFIKSQLFTYQQAEAMVQAGFRWILVGFESGSPRILENINKKATREENTRCMEIARRHGLKVKALMSMGHPGESRETVEQTKDWLLEMKPDDFDMTIITTYPGTPYYDHALKHPTMADVWTYTYQKTGDRLHSHEVDFTQVADFYKGKVGDYHSYVYTDHLSAEDMVRLRDGLEAEVRDKLKIPFNSSAAAVQYEHSMGLGRLPEYILKTSQ